MTTPERMKVTAPHLASVLDTTLELFIEDAAFEVSKLNAPAEYQERLVRYLAIHFASLSNKVVKSEKVGDLARTYAETSETGGLLSTPYGAEYQRLLDELFVPERKKLNLTVL